MEEKIPCISIPVKELTVLGKVFQSCDREEKSELADAAKHAVVRIPAAWGHSAWRREDLLAAFQYIKGVYKKDEKRLSPGPLVTGQGATVLN